MIKIKDITKRVLLGTLIGSYALYGGGNMAPTYEPVITVPEPVETPMQTLFYIGGGVAVAGVSRDCPCGDDSDRLKDMTYGLALRAGVDLIDYLGIEARYLATFIEKDFSEVTHYGLYLKPYLPIGQNTTLYGLLGYGKTSVECTGNRLTRTLDKSGVAYGGGVEFDMQENLSVWVDAQHLLGSEGKFNTDVNVGTAGLLYRFGVE